MFVCTGNTCRSPMIEMILKDFIKSKKKIDNITVKSAGIDVMVGEPINPLAKRVLKENKIPITAKKSALLTPKMLKKSDLTICMTDGQKQVISGYLNVYSMTEVIGCCVNDPYNLGVDAYQNTCKQFLDNIKIIWKFIKPKYDKWRKQNDSNSERPRRSTI